MKSVNTPTIITEKLILRKFEDADLLSLFAIYSNKEINKYLPWFPALTIDDAKEILANNYLNKYKNKTGYDYAICLKDNNIPIGYIKISMDDSYDLGYAQLPNYWNQGIASEAALALIKKAEIDKIPYITATHDINNLSSGAVMKNIGMKYKYSYEEFWEPKNYNVIFRMYQINFKKDNDFVYKKYWNKREFKMIEKF